MQCFLSTPVHTTPAQGNVYQALRTGHTDVVYTTCPPGWRVVLMRQNSAVSAEWQADRLGFRRLLEPFWKKDTWPDEM